MLPTKPLSDSPLPSPTVLANQPYRAKHPWPPDLSKLSQKHQFRLEKRYRRRSQLKWARPKFMLATRVLQWVGGIGVLAYGTLFYDWGGEDVAFKGLREWYRENVEEMVAGRRSVPRFGTSVREVSENGVDVMPR